MEYEGGITEHIVMGGDMDGSIMGGGYSEADMIQTVFIIFILIAMYMLWQNMSANKALPAQALAARGWYFYSKPGCPWCSRQLEALGGSYPNVITCAGAGAAVPKGALACADPKITGYPFWYNVQSKESRTGFQDKAALAAMAGGPPGAPSCPPPDCAACATAEICAACK